MADNERNEKYPSNAYRNITPNVNKPSTEKKKDLTPVAQGAEKKKSFRERLTDSFLASSGDDIKDRVIFDWIIPGVKNILEDIVHMLLFGDGVTRDSGRSRGGERRLLRKSYDKYYDEDKRKNDSELQNRSKNPELTYPSRAEAQDVLNKMVDILDEYGRVTVKDLYSLSKMSTDFAMSNWGWRDLTGSKPIPYGNRYLLKLPKSEELR